MALGGTEWIGWTHYPMTKRDDPDELGALRLYLSHGGLEGLARSSLGPMLDMLWRAGQSRRCDVCGGVGVVATANASMHTAELARVNAERGWGIAILREVKLPKGERPHLAEYRRLREEAATSEMNLVAAERYFEENRAAIEWNLYEESLARCEDPIDGIMLRNDRQAMVKRWGCQPEDDRHLVEYRRIREEAASNASKFTAAEQYRRANAHEIHREAAEENRGAATSLERMIRAERASVAAGCKSTVGEVFCQVCQGIGWRPREKVDAAPIGWLEDPEHPDDGGLDAQPTGNSVNRAGGVDPGDAATERMGRIAGRLAVVRSVDPLLADALCRYHAPQSGGALALWELTEPGRRLLAQHGHDDLPPAAIWADLADRQQKAPTVHLTRQLEETRRDALALAASALHAWRESATPRKVPTGIVGPPRGRFSAPRDPLLDQLIEGIREVLGAAQ